MRSQTLYFFFFSSRRRHTRFKCDWSSDVCASHAPKPTITRVTLTSALSITLFHFASMISSEFTFSSVLPRSVCFDERFSLWLVIRAAEKLVSWFLNLFFG